MDCWSGSSAEGGIPGREVGLGLWEDLAPRLPLLGRLLLVGGRRRGARELTAEFGENRRVHLLLAERLRRHDLQRVHCRGRGGGTEERRVHLAGCGEERLGGRVLELDVRRRGGGGIPSVHVDREALLVWAALMDMP